MEQFSLKKYLENTNRKVVTRGGSPARIVCWDNTEQRPIIAVGKGGNPWSTNENGCYKLNGEESNFDLFFADEEKELTELQKTLEEDCDYYVKLYNDGNTREELREWIKCWCHRIIELARKEIEKENPYSGNQKQEWSEEDKSMYIRTLGILGKCYMGELPTKVEEELRWFKSIEPQSHWKPSKDQMFALSMHIQENPNLESLYNNLKNLRS